MREVYSASSGKGFDIFMILFGAIIVWVCFDFASQCFTDLVIDFSFETLVLFFGLLVFIGIIGLGVYISITHLVSRKLQKFEEAIREGAFRVIDVRVTEIHPASTLGTQGTFMKVMDLSGNKYPQWAYTRFAFRGRAIMVHMLKGYLFNTKKVYIIPCFNPEDKYCKEHLDYY